MRRGDGAAGCPLVPVRRPEYTCEHTEGMPATIPHDRHRANGRDNGAASGQWGSADSGSAKYPKAT